MDLYIQQKEYQLTLFKRLALSMSHQRLTSGQI